MLTQTIAERVDGELQFKGLAPRVFEKLHRHGGLPTNFFQSF